MKKASKDLSLKFNSWSYDPAPENTDHIKIKEKYDLSIVGYLGIIKTLELVIRNYQQKSIRKDIIEYINSYDIYK